MNKQISNKNNDTKKSSRVESLKKNKKSSSVICAIVVVFVLGIIINHFNQKEIYNNNIAKNIFIENVDVSKMTKEKAIEAVVTNRSPKSISLSYEGKKYEISPIDIYLKYNVEETSFMYNM